MLATNLDFLKDLRLGTYGNLIKHTKSCFKILHGNCRKYAWIRSRHRDIMCNAHTHAHTCTHTYVHTQAIFKKEKGSQAKQLYNIAHTALLRLRVLADLK